MTRINCIPPRELTRQHLIAEYRELPRVFKLARQWHERGGGELPETYRLGTGHMKFFYDKLGFLFDRQLLLIVEMKARGYRPKHDNPSDLILGMPQELMGDWTPTDKARAQNRARIAERLRHSERVNKKET